MVTGGALWDYGKDWRGWVEEEGEEEGDGGRTEVSCTAFLNAFEEDSRKGQDGAAVQIRLVEGWGLGGDESAVGVAGLLMAGVEQGLGGDGRGAVERIARKFLPLPPRDWQRVFLAWVQGMHVAKIAAIPPSHFAEVIAQGAEEVEGDGGQFPVLYDWCKRSVSGGCVAVSRACSLLSDLAVDSIPAEGGEETGVLEVRGA